MAEEKKLYIVSFGDSEKYRFEFTPKPQMDPLKKCNPLADLEKNLHDFLEEKFPGRTFAYLVTPKITEVRIDHEEQYADYPVLDSKAVDQIKKVLVEEVKSRADLLQLNDNAPFSSISNSNF